MNKILPYLNSFVFVAMLIINYLSNTSLLAEETVGDISNRHPTLFTPAAYVFGVLFTYSYWVL